jgi:hypothetical protein
MKEIEHKLPNICRDLIEMRLDDIGYSLASTEWVLDTLKKAQIVL